MSVKYFATMLDCGEWLDDHYGPEYEDAECVHLDSKINADGWTVSHRWAVRLPSGEYVNDETGEETSVYSGG